MNLGLPALGAAFSSLLMIGLAAKWKLPNPQALVGIAVSAVLPALPFVWIYPLVRPGSGWALVAAGQVLVALAFGLSLVLVRFWRDPERVPPETEGVIVSAADGEVAYVWSTAEVSAPVVSKGGREYRLDELACVNLGTSAIHVIGVGMSLLDVHVNRCPISGQVKLIKHVAGKFISLGKAEAPFVNARLTTVIEGDSLDVVVVQIASRLVRCVQSYLKVGETVNTGQRLGMIRFGSLVAIIIPDREEVQIEVKPGDQVKAGVSVLARHRVNR